MLKSTMLGMLHIDGLARYCSPRHIHGGVEVMEVEKNKSGSDADEQVLRLTAALASMITATLALLAGCLGHGEPL